MNTEKKDGPYSTMSLNDAIPLKHQVAGHRVGIHVHGILELPKRGIVLKPVHRPPMGEREQKFYEELFNHKNRPEIFEKILPYIPRFYGTIAQEEVSYLKLENVVHGFLRPCIMDLKIGAINYDPEANDERIARKKAKFPPLSQVKFQVQGIKVFSNELNDYVTTDKITSRQFNVDEVFTKGIRHYFTPLLSALYRHGSSTHHQYRLHIMNAFIKDLNEIKAWFEIQRKKLFFCASLLFCYDAVYNDNISYNSSADEHLRQVELNVDPIIRLIDFAHVWTSYGERDDNFIDGLESVKFYFEKVLSEVESIKST